MKWIYPPPLTLPEDFQKMIGGHPLVAETIFKRGMRTPDQIKGFLDPDFYTPSSAFEFQDMQKAVDILGQAFTSGLPICVWGDFDVDGQTSTTLLVSALRQMKANVSFHIPVRAHESHGINLTVLKKLISAGVKLLLTCDTGIAAHEAIDYARTEGLKVIVTDHHKLPDQLPHADAIINPNFLSNDHPLAALPGVGVVYKFIEALNQVQGTNLGTDQYLDLVALGIVADVALLQGDNRYLLQKGLKLLQNSNRLGLLKLIKKAEVKQENIDEELIGFQIAPRLNAIGRLSDANPIVELLLTSDEGRAEVIATQIEGLNQRRKLLTRQVLGAALRQLENDPEIRRSPIIILHHPQWPAGIIGLVASRLVERYNKPVILLTGEDDSVHGSARSIEGLDITDIIASQSALLSNYGGHAMAAGLSLPIENLPAFRRAAGHAVAKQLQQTKQEPSLEISANLDLSDVSLPFIEDIKRLAPFGPGNPPLNFLVANLVIESDRKVGRNQEHRQVLVTNEQGIEQKVIWWNAGDEPLPTGKFDLVYRLSTNDYHGQRQVSLIWIDSHALKAVEVKQPAIKIIDHRRDSQPEQVLKTILNDTLHTLIWAENQPPRNQPYCARTKLSGADVLIIWNIPPAQKVLSNIIKTVRPKEIHFFARPSDAATLQEFLKTLAGLVKFAVNQRAGKINLSQLASATVQTPDIVRLGLRWLQEKGLYSFTTLSGEDIQAQNGSRSNPGLIKQINARLQELWSEHKAYQHYYQTCDSNNIIT